MVQSKNLAGVFAFCLGVFGVHRFYVHRDGSGALYVVASFLLALPVVLHFAGWFAAAFGELEATRWVALICIGLLVVLLCVAWTEAFRFWAMHPRKFDYLYAAPIVPARPESGLRERARDEPDADVWEEED